MTPQEWPFFPYEKIPERLELDESSWRALSRLRRPAIRSVRVTAVR